MPGTKAGAQKAALTNKQRDPHHYEKIGHRGGSAKVAKGFSMADKTTRIKLGAAGGRAPRRVKVKVSVDGPEDPKKSL